MKAKIINIECPVRYDAAINCEAFRKRARAAKQTLRRYQPRLSILGCFALLHAIRSAKPQNPSGLRRV